MKKQITIWVQIDQCDNMFLGLYTPQEKTDEDECRPPSDTGHYWDEWTFDLDDVLGDP